jgi:hypothetical protein
MFGKKNKFYRTAGNRFVNQTEFKRLLEQKVKSLDFFNLLLDKKEKFY